MTCACASNRAKLLPMFRPCNFSDGHGVFRHIVVVGWTSPCSSIRFCDTGTERYPSHHRLFPPDYVCFSGKGYSFFYTVMRLLSVAPQKFRFGVLMSMCWTFEENGTPSLCTSRIRSVCRLPGCHPAVPRPLPACALEPLNSLKTVLPETKVKIDRDSTLGPRWEQSERI